MEVLIIGISGVTCGGKTTLATELNKLIPDSVVFSQDGYCLDLKDPRHILCNEVNHINFDVITSLDMDKMLKDVRKTIGSKRILMMEKKCNGVESNGISNELLRTNIVEKLEKRRIQVIILDGFLLYAYKPILPLIHLKYFFTLDREECFARRKNRIYEPPDVPGYFEKCVWPEYLKHFEEVKASVENITYIDDSIKNPLDIVLRDILSVL